MKQTITCPICKKTFTGKSNRLYCSAECANKALNAIYEENVSRRKAEKEAERKKLCQLDVYLKGITAKGLTYAEAQKQETLKCVGRII